MAEQHRAGGRAERSPDHIDSHKADPLEHSVAIFRAARLGKELGRKAHVHAWPMLDGNGELGDPLFVVACSLCPEARTSNSEDLLAQWWAEHYKTHNVEGNGKRNA